MEDGVLCPGSFAQVMWLLPAGHLWIHSCWPSGGLPSRQPVPRKAGEPLPWAFGRRGLRRGSSITDEIPPQGCVSETAVQNAHRGRQTPRRKHSYTPHRPRASGLGVKKQGYLERLSGRKVQLQATSVKSLLKINLELLKFRGLEV